MNNQKYFSIRIKYEGKRRNQKWKERKKKNKLKRLHRISEYIKYKQDSFIPKSAPSNFDFINNTNEVLQYFNECGELFRKNRKVNFDISKIKVLTPDAISLLVASVNSAKFTKGGEYRGGAPDDEDLKNLFTKSGFYDFVRSSKFQKNNIDREISILHKERDYKVRPRIAKSACLHALKFLKKEENPLPFEELFEILIEAMQNTNNHASSKELEKTKWWLYVFNDHKSHTSKFSFLDLGVGIFESIVYKSYLKNLLIDLNLVSNADFVNDLLNGKIQSRIDVDNNIRGKGLPQIVNNAKLACFKKFYIISNDVKINIKNRNFESLKYNFKGTFIYWELKI